MVNQRPPSDQVRGSVAAVEEAAGHAGEVSRQGAQNVGVSLRRSSDFPQCRPRIDQPLVAPFGSIKLLEPTNKKTKQPQKQKKNSRAPPGEEASGACARRMAN